MIKRWQFYLLLMLCVVSMLWSSGVVPAIVPAAVPTANKIGNSSKFQLGASGAVAGDCPTFDANLNITGPGTGAACGTSASAGGGLTVYSGLAGVALTGTLFFPIGGGSQASATETNVDADISASTTISRFGANLSTALGVANSVVFTWRKNTTDQALTCTISGAVATSCADTTNSFAVVPGDLIDIKAVFSGTIAAAPVFILTAQAGSLVQGQVNTATAGNIGYYATSSATISGGNFTGDVSNSTLALTVNKVNGVAYTASPSTHTTPIITASNTATYTTIPDCQDSGGNHLNFTQSTNLYNCGTSGGGGTAQVPNIRQVFSNTGGLTIAFPANVLSTSYIFVMFGSNTANATAVSDTQSNTYTNVDNTNNGTVFGSMFWAKSATAGADTLTVTAAGATSTVLSVMEIVPPAGFAGTLDVHGTGTTGTSGFLLTGTAAGELYVAGLSMNHSGDTPLAFSPLVFGTWQGGNDGSAMASFIGQAAQSYLVQLVAIAGGGTARKTDSVVVAGAFK